MWKHYIVLFGGFYDPGIKSTSTLPPSRAVQLAQAVHSELSERSLDIRHAGVQMAADRIQGRRPEAIVCCTDLLPFHRQVLSTSPPCPLTRPRSGFSFLPTADGILLHGGYCKEYVKGSRPIGVMLDDTWFLRSVYSIEYHKLCLTVSLQDVPQHPRDGRRTIEAIGH